MFILLFLSILFFLTGLYFKQRYRSMSFKAFVRGEDIRTDKKKLPLIETVSNCLPGKTIIDWTERRLSQARLFQYTPESILTVSFILFIVFGFLGWSFGWILSGYLSSALTFALVVAFTGSALPYLYIRSEALKAGVLRKKEILPLIQQLKVLSRSGVGTTFNALAAIVVEEASGVLMEDIRGAIDDINRGKGRKEALLSMADITGSPVVKEVIELILDAEEKELPLYGVLESIETRMLLDIETRADEVKNKDEDALALPLAGLILPANMILMVAPGIIGIRSMISL